MSTTVVVQFVDSEVPLVFELDGAAGDFHDLPTAESTHMTVSRRGGDLVSLVPLRWVRQIVVEVSREEAGNDSAA